MAKTERIMKGGRELWPTINGGVGLKYLIYFNETEAKNCPQGSQKNLQMSFLSLSLLFLGILGE